MLLLTLLAFLPKAVAQDESLYVGFAIPAQNTMKFNRFLINPAFTAVRGSQSSLSLYHRNQSVSFDNNNQTYLLGYQSKSTERSGAGISVFSQRLGVISNYGVLANYAYGVKLGDKSEFTFGGNLAYYKSGYDESRAITGQFDPYLSGLQDGTYLKFQPGFNISTGAFDIGMTAENLIDYDLKTSNSLSDFSSKIFSGHLQYTRAFASNSGILESGQWRAMARARNNPTGDMELGGNLLLDLPKIGWIQAGYDSFYGASTGVGFNLNPQLSMGYVMERSVSGSLSNLGMTHEITLAYTFSPQISEDRKMLEADYDPEEDRQIAEAPPISDEEKKASEMEALKEVLAQNDAIIGQLTQRPDSLDALRRAALEKRFESALAAVRQKTGVDSFNVKVETEKTIGQEQVKILKANQTILDSLAEQKMPLVETLVDSAGQKTSENKQTRSKTITEQEVKPSGGESKPVLSRRFTNLKGVEPGYYVIANVYKGETYLEKFLKKMTSKGHQPDYITNPQNNLKYVYLHRFESLKEAEKAVRSQIDGAYLGTLWVMDVRPTSVDSKAIANNETKSQKREEYNDDILRKNVVIKDRLDSDSPDQESFKVGSKYYIIANVFKSSRNAARFIKHLNSLGLSANYFINPKNNYRYVYLKRHETWNGALMSYYSKLNEAYQAEMWIMRVTPDLIA